MPERVCVCGEHYNPWEPATNQLMAKVARWPDIGHEVWRSIWPCAESSCPECENLLTFAASTVGADWRLTCPAGHTAEHAENKPSGAAGHWTRARTEHYELALKRGWIIPAEDWPGIPAKTHEQPHPWSADQCWACASVKGTRGRVCRLSIPQVVRYAIDADRPCTLITDEPDATTVYRSQPFFRISREVAPLRAVPDVLNALAASIHDRALSEDQGDVLQAIATRLWWRTSWEQDAKIHANARALVSPTAYLCATGQCSNV